MCMPRAVGQASACFCVVYGASFVTLSSPHQALSACCPDQSPSSAPALLMWILLLLPWCLFAASRAAVANAPPVTVCQSDISRRLNPNCMCLAPGQQGSSAGAVCACPQLQAHQQERSEALKQQSNNLKSDGTIIQAAVPVPEW